MNELIDAAEKLLEWVPKCSKGSSGDQRQERLRAAITKVRCEHPYSQYPKICPLCNGRSFACELCELIKADWPVDKRFRRIPADEASI